jgi:hypothetical protein
MRVYWRMIRFINGQLPEDSRVLMLFDSRGHYLKPSVIQDNLSTNWVLLDAAEATDDCLESLGITHILVGLGSLRYYSFSGLDLDRLGWSDFVEFAGTCLVPIYESGGHVLFEVNPTAASAEAADSSKADAESAH